MKLKAYRKLAKKFHPDKNSESNEYTEEFKLTMRLMKKLKDYLENKTNISNESTDKSTNAYTKNSGSGLVKSDAKFAEAIEDSNNDSFFNIIIGVLISIFILLGFYSAFNQNTILIKIVYIIFVSFFTGCFVYSAYKQSRTFTLMKDTYCPKCRTHLILTDSIENSKFIKCSSCKISFENPHHIKLKIAINYNKKITSHWF